MEQSKEQFLLDLEKRPDGRDYLQSSKMSQTKNPRVARFAAFAIYIGPVPATFQSVDLGHIGSDGTGLKFGVGSKADDP